MAYRDIPLQLLMVNPANDRHGELPNETAAIAELFRTRDQHMRNLARDIVDEGAIYDPPLVRLVDGRYVVFDGNRRVTCIKLILRPEDAPTQDLQEYFADLRQRWDGEIPDIITCQIEEDPEVIDNIVFRRHTGVQGGVGQSDWDDRAKHNFIERTGRGGRVDVAVEIERLLQDEGRAPQNGLPRSTLNRLLSSELNRNRVGVSTLGNTFTLTHERGRVVNSLARIADDLSNRRIVLGDLWDNQGKTSYLNRLDVENVLPDENDVVPVPQEQPRPRRRAAGGRPPVHRVVDTFIPTDAPEIPWRANQARIRSIWSELQTLSLVRHPNAVSALIRILVELSTESFLQNVGRPLGQGLSANFRTAISHMSDHAMVDGEYHNELERMRHHSELISIQSMQRYVHSQNFAPMADEMAAFWVRLQHYLVVCLTH